MRAAPETPSLPSEVGSDFGILFVLGSTASGKTRFIRKHFGDPEAIEWDPAKAIVSQVGTVDELLAVGLGDIPAWNRPFHNLSNGQQARALLARMLKSGAVIDDFTTWVNRITAKAMARAAARYVSKRCLRRIVIASSCADIVPYLQPDLVINLDAARGSEGRQALLRNPNAQEVRQPAISFDIVAPWQRDRKAADKGEFAEYKLVAGTTKDAAAGRHWHVYDELCAAGAPLVRASGRRGASDGVVCTEPVKMVSGVVALDDKTKLASEAFDYEFTGRTTFVVPALPLELIPPDFCIGVIVGPSGSGKTSLLRQLLDSRECGTLTGSASGTAAANVPADGGAEAATAKHPVAGLGAEAWEAGRAVRAHWPSEAEAEEALSAVQASREVWDRSFECLSSGEQFQASLARSLRDGCVVDEFTSAVDRPLACRVARSVGAHLRSKAVRGLVVASCHHDFIPALQPDWVYDTQAHELALRGPAADATQGFRAAAASLPLAPRGAGGQEEAGQVSEERIGPERLFEIPSIRLEVSLTCDKEAYWNLFRDHHYKTGEQQAAHFWVVRWDGRPVGCVATVSAPGTYPYNLKAFREHRTVLLPDFQGIGIGVRMTDAVADSYVRHGWLFYSMTAHPRMGQHRQSSALWGPTARNIQFSELKAVNGTSARLKAVGREVPDKFRICFSHVFIGDSSTREHFRNAVKDAQSRGLDIIAQACCAREEKAGTTEAQMAKARALRDRKARQVQEGRVAKAQPWSKGGVSGPVKVQGVLAFAVSCKPRLLELGDCCLEVAIALPRGKESARVVRPSEAKRVRAGTRVQTFAVDVFWDPNNAKMPAEFYIHSDVKHRDSCHGDLNGVLAEVCKRTGAKCFDKPRDVWNAFESGGCSVQEIKMLAVEEAKLKRCNPRSIEEWAALGRGDIGRIRKLGPNAEPAGPASEVARESRVSGVVRGAIGGKRGAGRTGGGQASRLAAATRRRATEQAKDGQGKGDDEGGIEDQDPEDVENEPSTHQMKRARGARRSGGKPDRSDHTEPECTDDSVFNVEARPPKRAGHANKRKLEAETQELRVAIKCARAMDGNDPHVRADMAAERGARTSSQCTSKRAHAASMGCRTSPRFAAECEAGGKPQTRAGDADVRECMADQIRGLDEKLEWTHMKTSWRFAQAPWVRRLQQGESVTPLLCAQSLLTIERAIQSNKLGEDWVARRSWWQTKLQTVLEVNCTTALWSIVDECLGELQQSIDALVLRSGSGVADRFSSILQR